MSSSSTRLKVRYTRLSPPHTVCTKCVLRALTVFCLDRVVRGPCQIPVSWLWLRFIVKVISTIVVRSMRRDQERKESRSLVLLREHPRFVWIDGDVGNFWILSCWNIFQNFENWCYFPIFRYRKNWKFKSCFNKRSWSILFKKKKKKDWLTSLKNRVQMDLKILIDIEFSIKHPIYV